MNEKLKIIRLYRIELDEPWDVFAKRIADETGLSWSTVYKVVTGKSKNPHERTLHKIDIWIENNLDKINKNINATLRSA